MSSLYHGRKNMVESSLDLIIKYNILQYSRADSNKVESWELNASWLDRFW